MGEYYSKSTIDKFLNLWHRLKLMLTPANVMTILNAIPTVDAEQIVRCKDCKHRGRFEKNHKIYPDDVCPAQCADGYYSWLPPDDWFCADGEKRND